MKIFSIHERNSILRVLKGFCESLHRLQHLESNMLVSVCYNHATIQKIFKNK